jgi:hypothetical protein
MQEKPGTSDEESESTRLWPRFVSIDLALNSFFSSIGNGDRAPTGAWSLDIKVDGGQYTRVITAHVKDISNSFWYCEKLHTIVIYVHWQYPQSLNGEAKFSENNRPLHTLMNVYSKFGNTL